MENNGLIRALKKELENKLNESYTEYKNKCLENLNNELEIKRTNCITELINSINIVMQENEYGLEPIVNIRIERRL